MPYIDLHCHILPGLDDGPGDLNSSLELARAMVDQGCTSAVATPHSFAGKPYPAEILYQLDILKKWLVKNNIPLQLLPGCEHVIEPQLLERVRTGELLTLNKTRYLLLELPSQQPVPSFTGELIFELKVRGYYPVLAHPERVAVIQKDPALLHQLIQAGALGQLTLGSLTGLFGPETKQAALTALSHNLVHFVATDAHQAGRRLAAVAEGMAMLDQLGGTGTAWLMMHERPSRLLENLPLELPEQVLPQHRKKKGGLFNRIRGLA